MRSADAGSLGSLGFERPVEHPAGVCLVPGDSVSFLRALVLVVLTGLVMVAVPAVTSAATAPDDGSAPRAAVASASSSPTTTAPLPAQASLDARTPDGLTRYRYLGVPVSASDVRAESVELRLDGTAVETFGVTGGGFDEYVTFPTISVGTHRLTLHDGDAQLAAQTIEVLPDPFVVTASPAWVTADKLAADGVRLSAQGLPAAIGASGYLGDNVARGTAGGDGRVDVTVRNDGDEFLAQPGVNRAILELENGAVGSTEVRTTVLGLTVREGGGAVVGTGFEPGTDVTLVDGSTRRGAQSDSSGRVEFSALAGSRALTLTGTAGSITRTLDPGGSGGTDPAGPGLSESQVRRLEQVGQATQDAKQAAQDVQEQLARLAAAPGPRLADELKKSIDAQLELTEQVVGAKMPTRAPIGSRPGGSIGFDPRPVEDERDAQFEEAKAAYEQQLGDATKEQQQALEEMMRQIIGFITEMQQAQQDQLRVIVRASTIEVVFTGPLPSGAVSVDVPTGFSGRHHVGAIDPSTGIVTAWQPFDVVAAGSDGSGPGGSGSALPDTGAPVQPALLALGAGLLLAGGATFVARRRRSA